MSAPAFDLQSHSTRSDGELSPTEVVNAAHRAGVELLALTDHDSVDGIQEATAAAREVGIRLVPAVEISTLDDGARDPSTGIPTAGIPTDLHICGYGLEPSHAELQDQLRRSREQREQRAQAMIEALTELGWLVDQQLLEDQRAGDGSVGRPHLALAVVAHGANAERLEKEGLTDPTAFLSAYLTEGKPAFRPREAPSVGEAIAVIHAAGGVAVWAHPFWDLGTEDQVRESADRFRALGLDGIEAFYVAFTRAQVEMLAGYCTRHGLLSTGSSDFHGPSHSRFNRFRAFDTYGLQPDLGPLLEWRG